MMKTSSRAVERSRSTIHLTHNCETNHYINYQDTLCLNTRQPGTVFKILVNRQSEIRIYYFPGIKSNQINTGSGCPQIGRASCRERV